MPVREIENGHPESVRVLQIDFQLPTQCTVADRLRAAQPSLTIEQPPEIKERRTARRVSVHFFQRRSLLRRKRRGVIHDPPAKRWLCDSQHAIAPDRGRQLPGL